VFDAVHLETVPADSHIASLLECALRAMCFHVWSSNDELTTIVGIPAEERLRFKDRGTSKELGIAHVRPGMP